MNIFDFIALLLHELGNDAKSRYAGLQPLSFVPGEKYTQFADSFITTIKTHYSNSGNITDISDYQLSKTLPDELLEKYFGNTEFRQNKDAVFYLVTRICKQLFNKKNIKAAAENTFQMSMAYNGQNGFSQLNSECSAKETGYLLLPDLGTFGDENKINKTTTPFEKILLKDLIVLQSSGLQTSNGQYYEVRNLLPMSYSHGNTYPQNGILRIAVSPVCDKWMLKDRPIVKKGNFGTLEYCFANDGIIDENHIHSRVNAAYQKACEQKAHILVFPEMYGTELLSMNADSVIDNANQEAAPLVVMPSLWIKNENVSYVQDDSLSVLFGQHKFAPFLYNADSSRYQAPSLEDLQNKEHVVYLYHIPDVGRVCICICKDFLMDSYRRMLSETLEASIILIPAFTPVIEHFTNCMGELRHAGSYGIFINCCAAVCNRSGQYTPVSANQAVGAVSLTKAISEEHDNSFRLLFPECGGNCGESASCCLFIIEITSEGNIITEHIYE
jgi:hypothetical protein